MFAFFGIGTQELVLLGLLFGLVALVALVVVYFRATGGSGGRVAALEEENRRLRDELDRDRRG
jgi:hypothetical protein